MVWACNSSEVILVGESRSGLYFYSLLCRVSLYVQPFVKFPFRVFLFFWCFGCVVFSKTESFGSGCLLTFLCFIWLWKNLKGVFKKLVYPVLIWFYSGFCTVGFFS